MQNPKHKPPTPEEIVAQQRRDAERAKRQKARARPPVTTTTVTTRPVEPLPALAAVDNRTPEQKYVDEIAPTMIAGQLVKFSKEGKFVINETGEEISPDTPFVALADETLCGWIRFHGDDTPPDRVQGLLYDGFVMPPRASLGDTDESLWEPGLSGAPADPWQHQICLVLQDPATESLYTFSTSSITGRRAVGNLLRHYDRIRRTDASVYPVVKLRPTGFQHKKVGWVHTPSFVVVSRVAKSSDIKAALVLPQVPSLAKDFNDEIPF